LLPAIFGSESRRSLVAVATHCHLDHIGGMYEVPERLAHEAEVAVLAEPVQVPLVGSDIDDDARAMLTEAGYPIGEFLLTAVPDSSFDLTAFRTVPTSATRHLVDGDVIDLGDRAFEVLHLPGHSPGSIGLWEPSTRTLFSGDAIYDGPLLDELPESNIEQYCETMRRLLDLPVSVVHAGHDPSFSRARLVEIATDYLRRRA
jgi:glyoxylase-like metal-dependent hydrolase (beta-lactamase superfamily II)